MHYKTVIEEIQQGKWDTTFQYIYGSNESVQAIQLRFIGLLERFHEVYEEDDIMIFSAPGRSEVGGNHTDHQHGCVLAAGLQLDTIAVVAKTKDNYIDITSEGFAIEPIDIHELRVSEDETMTSQALVRGVVAGFVNVGKQVGGFHACMSSNVIEGAGLSSSAAFEVLLGTILSSLYNEDIDAVEIAKIAQYSENVYFGKPCGLMDQMACSVGGFVAIDFHEPKLPLIKKVNYDFRNADHSLCIVNTKGSHADLTPDYAAIPYEMSEVAHYFGKAVLRDVKEQDFYACIDEVRKLLGDRCVLRALHFFEEHKRAIAEAEALEAQDFEAFLRLVTASGNSSFKYLQNIYSPTHPNQQSIAVALAVAEQLLQGQGACRVHGGGFAGTIQAFVPNAILASFQQGMDAVFGANACHVLSIRPVGGYRFI